MANLLEDLQGMFGPQVSGELQSKFNLNEEQAKGALDTVGPLVLSGLKREMVNRGGGERVGHIVDKYGDEDALDHLDSYFAKQEQELNDPDPGLGGLLGESGHEAAGLMEQKLGLSAGTGAKLIPMLAPLILGGLAKTRKSGGLSGMASMLDRDGDGSILDDVAGMIMGGGSRGAGRTVSRGSSQGGCLGSLLGGLLKGRR